MKRLLLATSLVSGLLPSHKVAPSVISSELQRGVGEGWLADLRWPNFLIDRRGSCSRASPPMQLQPAESWRFVLAPTIGRQPASCGSTGKESNLVRSGRPLPIPTFHYLQTENSSWPIKQLSIFGRPT